MSLTVNSTIVPENIANAMNFNGNDVTQVFMNGVEVWLQDLFSATWSGNSYETSNGLGINTSGGLCRIDYTGLGYGYGNWISADSSGLKSGLSQVDAFGLKGFTTVQSGGITSWEQIPTQTGAVSFSVVTRNFTSSTGTYTTSGGAIRFSDGAFITLT